MRSKRFGHNAPLVVTVALTLGFLGEAVAQDLKPALLLTNVRIFDARSGKFAEPQDLLIRDGRIVQVGAVNKADVDASRIDAGGAYALPGLWDSHVHLTPLTLRGGDTLKTTLDGMIRHGVLYVRDVGGPLDVIASVARRINDGELRGPTVFFAGPLAERPPLYWARSNSLLPGFTVPIESEHDVDTLITKIAAAGGTFVKAFGKWDRQLFRLLRKRAMDRDLGLVVDPGTPLFQDLPVDTLLTIGGTSIEHAHSVWLTLLRADLRIRHDAIAAQPPDPTRRGRFALEVISQGPKSFDAGKLRRLGELWKRTGVFFTPTLRVSENRRRGSLPVPFATSEEQRSQFWNGWADASVAVTQSLASQKIPFLIGQDDLDPIATFEEMEMLARIGVPAADILRAATLNAARATRRDAELGSIETGKVGDVVLFRANPLESVEQLRSPWLVVQRGNVIHRRD